MTPTELWDIYYHAMKKWLPKATDEEIRMIVEDFMDMSVDIAIKFPGEERG